MITGTAQNYLTEEERPSISVNNNSLKIFAKSIYKQLNQQGIQPKDVIAISTKLLELVTEDLKKK